MERHTWKVQWGTGQKGVADLDSRPEWGPTLEKWRELGQVRWTIELLSLVA
ncbi:MAG: hypothetical protein ACK2UX_03380 [Anaerolineae bacterium]